MKRVALVGAGGMGSRHAAAYDCMPDAELVAVCDPIQEAADKMAEMYSVASYSTIEKCLAAEEVDVVDVCTPTPNHVDIIKEAASAGKDVCVEKPLARSISQAQEAVRVCEEAGVTLFVAHVVRWFPEFRKLHDLIENGAVGDPVIVRTTRSGAPPGNAKPWFMDFRQSGGVVLDLIIHDFDWLRWCFGDVTRVYARGLAEAGLPLDYALVTLRFENGVIAHVEGGWARPTGFVTTVEVAGTQGLLNFTNTDSVPLKIERRGEAGGATGVIIPESPTSVNPYYRELEHFITCLEEGKQPDVTPRDGLEAVRIAEAALRSISTGEPVALV